MCFTVPSIPVYLPLLTFQSLYITPTRPACPALVDLPLRSSRGKLAVQSNFWGEFYYVAIFSGVKFYYNGKIIVIFPWGRGGGVVGGGGGTTMGEKLLSDMYQFTLCKRNFYDHSLNT